MGETKITTLQLPVEVSFLISQLAKNEAKKLNLPRLSKASYLEMLIRNQADKELK